MTGLSIATATTPRFLFFFMLHLLSPSSTSPLFPFISTLILPYESSSAIPLLPLYGLPLILYSRFFPLRLVETIVTMPATGHVSFIKPRYEFLIPPPSPEKLRPTALLLSPVQSKDLPKTYILRLLRLNFFYRIFDQIFFINIFRYLFFILPIISIRRSFLRSKLLKTHLSIYIIQIEKNNEEFLVI